jgi:hypothetical protein
MEHKWTTKVRQKSFNFRFFNVLAGLTRLTWLTWTLQVKTTKEPQLKIDQVLRVRIAQEEGEGSNVTQPKQALHTGQLASVSWCGRNEQWPRGVTKLADVRVLSSSTYIQRPACEANSRSASQENLRLLWNPNVHCCVHKSPPPVPFLSHMNPVYALPIYFLQDLFQCNPTIYFKI